MAFRPLTEGDCGQVNPLTKLTSHITQDHTFSDNHGQTFPSSSDQLVEQFLQETRTVPQSFRMDDLMREMHEIESQRAILPPITASAIKDQLQDNAWAQQYLQDGKTFQEHDYNDVWNEMTAQGQDGINFNMFEDAWKAVEALEMEKANLNQGGSVPLQGGIEDSNFVYSKFMRFMKNDEESKLNLEQGKLTHDEAQAWTDEFLHSADTASLDDVWAESYDKSTVDEEKPAFWDQLQKDIEKAMGNDENSAHPWLDEFNSYYNTPHKEYEFSTENPMSDLPNPLERGKELLNQGDLPSAVLCFEAAVKQQPDNTEAWLLLGTTQAENEQDPSAIAALNKCLQLDPTNLKALMAAAVSYTNESYYNQACFMLVNWLKNNPKYRDLVPPDMNLSRQVTSLTNQKLVQDLYLKAAQRNPQNLDYEVQSGLGVLCNLTGEYEKAADCFRAALSVKPDDARLWNRLGATLANGSKSEEAVEAYHHALRLSPGFIRARYNVGITCINLRAYREAAEHFLTALNQQARGKDVLNSGATSQMSDTIWSTLQMCLSLMDRTDLRPLVKDRNLAELNKIFNID
ncbi:peroxisomal targeting signal 1 receptor isoform X2 [Anthonomus grandis grandis]|uniref:peroxisomal targeting signal 1 receptor isoform X2 n=1 Tax=Anthonomus grandis grandis TaxID=2921223 RepID=UPI00216612C6|nr:peroxisomal targeting signal 1 receptor isoform X2 [Anthonomus grandis grandis]